MPKIHRSVVKPGGFEKMRVSYAFRIFSDEVRRGLFMYKEQIEWRHGSINATESFVRLMKDVIEIMTSRFPAAALRASSRKADRLAEFLEYLNEWERSAENSGFISATTAEGLRLTLSSTLSLLQYATTKLGFRSVMSNVANVTMTVLRLPPTPFPTKPTPSPHKETSGIKFITEHWWTAVIVIVFLFVLVVFVIIAYTFYSRRVADEADE
ncbi:hypothetical protein HPB49_008334 [Dermacentor silvarum]|uniref:Uncharacterized protein n=1 Tax=Dermacentor silvarum TaxID=543639 RepID=A0ACB8C8F8_DERSI|nr:hypothetical protein HPB49_008334 [Dermacentor silvarum]